MALRVVVLVNGGDSGISDKGGDSGGGNGFFSRGEGAAVEKKARGEKGKKRKDYYKLVTLMKVY